MTKKKESNSGFVDIRLGDCLELLKGIPDSSIDFMLTDPPYFLDQLDDKWSKSGIEKNMRRSSAIGGLPAGMKFDPAQSRRLQEFFHRVSTEAMRVMKPGAFMVAFSQGRLVHRLAVAAEDAGFEIRDLFIWEHEGGQGKAFSQNHFIERMNIPETAKRKLVAELGGRKTPQLRPRFEPMILAQKPKEGTFVQNWVKWRTGLVQLEFPADTYQQTTIFQYKKPHKNKEFDHMTIKPVEMFERLIEVFTVPGQTVLDPFIGSGTAAVAALNTGRNLVGFEIDPTYHDNALRRINELGKS